MGACTQWIAGLLSRARDRGQPVGPGQSYQRIFALLAAWPIADPPTTGPGVSLPCGLSGALRLVPRRSCSRRSALWSGWLWLLDRLGGHDLEHVPPGGRAMPLRVMTTAISSRWPPLPSMSSGDAPRPRRRRRQRQWRGRSLDRTFVGMQPPLRIGRRAYSFGSLPHRTKGRPFWRMGEAVGTASSGTKPTPLGLTRSLATSPIERTRSASTSPREASRGEKGPCPASTRRRQIASSGAWPRAVMAAAVAAVSPVRMAPIGLADARNTLCA